MFNKERPVELIVDTEKCVNCKACVTICPAEYLIAEDNTIKANENSAFGCIQCGHCMMACPKDCIEIKGDSISNEDVFSLPETIPDYNAFNTLLLKRRSVRKFKKQEVSQDLIEQVLNAGATAAISVPPTEVKVFVINGTDKVQELADELVKDFEKTIKTMNPFVLSLMKPFMGAETIKLFKDFILPLMKITTDQRKQGKDILFYNAPCLVVFYGPKSLGGDDQILASAHATLGAEALGLGTCIIGSVPPMLERNKTLMNKYGLTENEKPLLAFILGYPEKTFTKGVKRQFKEVKYH